MTIRTINIPATTDLDADELTSGTVPFARLSTGTGSTQVAVGDHTHTAAGWNGESSTTVTAPAPAPRSSLMGRWTLWRSCPGSPSPNPTRNPPLVLRLRWRRSPRKSTRSSPLKRGVDPAVMAQLVTLGATLVGSADQLQSALTAVSGSNTAKAPLQIVNAAVQAAADT